MIAHIEPWLRGPARSSRVYIVAALLGLATYVIVYGAGHLVGTNAYWDMPQQDERMALMGYRYFLHEAWQWPMFESHAVNVPYPKSVAFLDCIPIWALVNKSLATTIPPWESFSDRAYLGLWHGLTYALQPCLGVACVRALGHRSWRVAFVTALVFVAIPTWIFRYGHPALSAHWIELWALYLYLRTPVGEPSPRKLGVAKIAQLVVASLVSPYHPAMCLPIFFASLLRSRHRRTIAIWLPIGIVAVGLSLWFAGYFATEITRPHWGFAKESANLLGWLVPQRSGIVGDAQWIANVNGTPWQWEGYAYLGLGMIGLLALFVPHAKSLGAVIRRHRYLFAITVGAAVFALSNHIYFGSHEIASYPIPRFLRFIPDQFRSPGRFVWIPTYVLLLYLLHWAFTRYTTWKKFAIVAALALIQLVDATGEWARQRELTAGASPGTMDLAGWRTLVRAHDEVRIFPPYSCVNTDNAWTLDQVSMQIQMLASERALPINGTYSARDMRECIAEENAWPTLEPADRTVYVLLPPALAIADRFAAQGAHCGVFAYGRVCSTNGNAIAGALRANILMP